MIKHLLITYFLLITLGSSAQKNQLSNFYPSIEKIDKDLIEKGYYLATGCAEGNCENGNGKFVVVKFVDQGNYKEQYFGNLYYKIYNGEFSKKDSSFKGQCLQLIVKVTMNKGKKFYTPDERQPNFSNAKLISAGSFRKKFVEKNNIAQDDYVKHGMVEVYEWEAKKNYYNEYQSFSGYYFDDKLKYAHVVYPDNYPMNTKWFTGIVTTKGKPVMGIHQTKKGLLENYRPYEQLPGTYANSLYDTALLLALVKTDAKNTRLSFTIPDDAGTYFSNQNNTIQKKYDTDSGFIFLPGKKIAESNYTGAGIFYTNTGKLYAGQFSNGKPHGEGWLFVAGDSNDPTLSYKEHNLFGLFVAGLIQNGWYAAADHIYFNSPYRIISKTDLASEWAALQKKAENGDAQAMFDFAKKYYGSGAPEPDSSKAIEWMEKAATAGYMPAIEKLVDMYAVELDFKMDSRKIKYQEKQAYWAGVICKKDKVLANRQRTALEKSYYQIYWGHYSYYLNHWYHENGSSKWTNSPFIPLNELTPEKENFYKWVNDEIKRESSAGNYYTTRTSNYTLQPLTIVNDSNMTFNVKVYHYGKLPESLEFSISRFDQTVKEENNQRITNRSRNALVCTFDKDDARYTGMMSNRACNNGSLAYVFKNEKFAADYFFNLTPVSKPGMKVYENWNRKGYDQLVDYSSNVIWAIFIKR